MFLYTRFFILPIIDIFKNYYLSAELSVIDTELLNYFNFDLITYLCEFKSAKPWIDYSIESAVFKVKKDVAQVIFSAPGVRTCVMDPHYR